MTNSNQSFRFSDDYLYTPSTSSPTVETVVPQDIEEGNDAQRVIQGIEELVQQEHDNTLNSLKGLLKDRFNFLLEYPYDYSKGFIESFLSDLVSEIDEF